ncbi:BlaI/MecI/CopY family transcriptional regulator [Fusibacter paucivorans]|uniref:BlaI/MecI/CopY family transcriptional regulator n=1 Tax=Fusibacter paucivorans TaxID=76009 RepID=A0ABS5PM25_9FIRM|nr:BlaI/MecI/CopY family transcriptional regulator [Fusibacter paucivorans]MBS7525411.1 BlaI/MecI/CopY family transcriptional regulator [Fusibacter paucivorans]
METYKLGEMEQRFADLIWQREPISSGELVKLCDTAFDWRKSTTYTMLKRLCDRGIFENQKGTVTALIAREDFLVIQGEQFLTETFDGSLPQFLAAFTRRNKLSEKEILEIQRLIDTHKEG